jgi:hypothetical protein
MALTLRVPALLAGLAALLMGCATTAPPFAATDRPESTQAWLQRQWQSQQFDGLRHRMPVHARDVTFEMLNTPARISRTEQASLAAWAEIVLQAQRRTLDEDWAGEPPEILALGEAARSRYASNLLRLHNGVVTWGEFNRQALVIDAELQHALATARLTR